MNRRSAGARRGGARRARIDGNKHQVQEPKLSAWREVEIRTSVATKIV